MLALTADGPVLRTKRVSSPMHGYSGVFSTFVGEYWLHSTLSSAPLAASMTN